MAKQYFVMGIGGTGMRCIESLIHLCAMGMFDETEIHLLALDTDKNNGNFSRLKKVKEAYLNSKGGDREVDEFYEFAYLQTNEEIIENLKKSDFSEDYIMQMFDNSYNIFEKIENYSLAHKQTIPKVSVPDYPKKSFDKEHYPILASMFESDDKVNRYWVNKCVDKQI